MKKNTSSRPKKYKFQKRVEALFPDFDVSSYGESARGASKKIKGLEDYRPWVEMTLTPRANSRVGSYVLLKDLNRLAELFGTDDIMVHGYDNGFDCLKCGPKDTEFVSYVAAFGVDFK